MFPDLSGRSDGHGRAQKKSADMMDEKYMEVNQNFLTLNVNFTAFLASNLLAQFSRQIVVQILGLESKRFVGISHCCDLGEFVVP
jgi:hypothetical protein